MKTFIYPVEVVQMHRLGRKSWRCIVQFSAGPKRKGMCQGSGKSGTRIGAYKSALMDLKMNDQFGSRRKAKQSIDDKNTLWV